MNVVICGTSSYIGEHIKSRLESFGHKVKEIDMTKEDWKNNDFSETDAVVHVAAIVHENAKTCAEDVFYSVNTKLPCEVAELAKSQGVKIFVFMSTMAVYGCEKALPKGNVVSKDTPLNPCTLYGKSKLEAEELLHKTETEDFKIAIVRPPNVYGKACKGNYIKGFHSLATKLPVFPMAFSASKQSMLYIDNLSELVRLIIENQASGTFMPQDDFSPNTCDLVKAIAEAANKKIVFSRFLGLCLKPFSFLSIVNKLYGGVSYDDEISAAFNGEYRIVSFDDGTKKTIQ